jgi:hypothetical protein
MGTYYHGTTLENVQAIMAGGSKNSPTWSCSDDHYLYLWSAEKIGDDGCPIMRALESAQITAAIAGKDAKLVVLELTIDDELVEDDWSCENMADEASCIHFDDFKVDMVDDEVYYSEFSGYLSPFVLSTLLENQWFDSHSVSKSLMLVARALQGQEIFIEEAWEFDYEAATLKDLA